MEEVSALGAAFLAGLHLGIFKDMQHISQLIAVTSQNMPSDNAKENRHYYKAWLAHIQKLIH